MCLLQQSLVGNQINAGKGLEAASLEVFKTGWRWEHGLVVVLTDGLTQ